VAKTVDLRTYLLLERAFVRRLQRAWRIQSAPLYARITQACLDHKWDEARRLVTFLDMTEVGTSNREWITYMLLSFATFGAQTVAKKKPSFVGVGTFDTFLKQVTNNIIQYLEFTATAKIQEDALHLIATDEANTKALKFDPAQPRDEHGRWVDAEGVTHVGEFVELYHGTSRRRANKILKEGFRIRAVAKQTMGGDPEGHRDYIWLAKRMASAKSYSEMHAQPAVVTVRLPRLLYEGLKRNSGPDSVWSREPIPAKFVTVTKWDESEHPRDRAGKFTESSAGSDAMLDITLEAVSPERAKIRAEAVRVLANEMAQKMGFDPSRIDIVHEEAKGFSVGAKQFTEAGHFDPTTGRIQLNAANIGSTYGDPTLSYGDRIDIQGVVSHEISHAIFHALKQASEREEEAYKKKAFTPTDQYSEWFLERFSMQTGPSGRTGRQLKPEYAEEFARDYPASTVVARLAGGEYFRGSLGITKQMIQEDGHSTYAESYWTPEAIAEQKKDSRWHPYDHAITETIAEITRFMTTPQSWDEKEKPDPDSQWVMLTEMMYEWHKWYRA
jgi:RNA:NAD 2'-phosphotransferase (TPT1/KptA family)